MNYIILALIALLSIIISRMFRNHPFAVKLRRNRGTFILFLALTTLCVLQGFQTLYLPFYAFIALGFFYFIKNAK